MSFILRAFTKSSSRLYWKLRTVKSFKEIALLSSAFPWWCCLHILIRLYSQGGFYFLVWCIKSSRKLQLGSTFLWYFLVSVAIHGTALCCDVLPIFRRFQVTCRRTGNSQTLNIPRLQNSSGLRTFFIMEQLVHGILTQ